MLDKLRRQIGGQGISQRQKANSRVIIRFGTAHRDRGRIGRDAFKHLQVTKINDRLKGGFIKQKLTKRFTRTGLEERA